MEYRQELAIIGAGGHAKSVADAALAAGYVISFFVDERLQGGELLGTPIVGALDASETTQCVVAIGDNHRRAKVSEALLSTHPSLSFARIVHPTAYVSSFSKVGEGCVVLAHANVNAGCTVERGCIINSHASLDHDVRMGQYSSLAPGAIVGGNVVIERCSAINMGAKVKHGVQIGEHCVIGANSYVHHDCAARNVYYGTPARKIRSRGEGEAYL